MKFSMKTAGVEVCISSPAWFMVVTGLIYLFTAVLSGHFRNALIPKVPELKPGHLKRDIVDHFRMRIPKATGGPHYGVLQKFSYLAVIVVLLPLVIVTGFTMAPAITTAYPFLLKLFGGMQSARTIHFFASVALVMFLIVHVVMIIRSGFVKHIRSMTIGK